MIIQARYIIRRIVNACGGLNYRDMVNRWQNLSPTIIYDVVKRSKEFLEVIDPTSDFYITHGGLTCPKCKKSDIEADTLDADGTTATSNVTCRNCGWEGIEQWELVGVEEPASLPEGGNNGAQSQASTAGQDPA